MSETERKRGHEALEVVGKAAARVRDVVGKMPPPPGLPIWADGTLIQYLIEELQRSIYNPKSGSYGPLNKLLKRVKNTFICWHI